MFVKFERGNYNITLVLLLVACKKVQHLPVDIQILPIENEMKHPKHFPAILYLGMTVVSVLYVIMGTIGYLKYGGDIRGSITLNLPAEAP